MKQKNDTDVKGANPTEEFEGLQKGQTQTSNTTTISTKEELIPFMKFGKASAITGKLIWRGAKGLGNGIYNTLLAINQKLEETRKSEFGKNLMKQHQKASATMRLNAPNSPNFERKSKKGTNTQVWW